MADILLQKPTAGQSTTLAPQAEDRLVFEFDSAEATLTRDGDNLVMSFEDGASLSLTDFYVAYTSENMPTFLIGGAEVDGESFFAALGEELMPAAGGVNSSPQGSGSSVDTIAGTLLGGIDRLGRLDQAYPDENFEEEDLGASGIDGDGDGLVGVGNVNLIPDANADVAVVAEGGFIKDSLWDNDIAGDVDGGHSGREVIHVVAPDGWREITSEELQAEGVDPSLWDNLGTDFGFWHPETGDILIVDKDGDYTFLPQDESLTDGESKDIVFEYTIEDSDGDTDTSTLTVTVTGTDDKPNLDTSAGNEGEDYPDGGLNPDVDPDKNPDEDGYIKNPITDPTIGSNTLVTYDDESDGRDKNADDDNDAHTTKGNFTFTLGDGETTVTVTGKDGSSFEVTVNADGTLSYDSKALVQGEHGTLTDFTVSKDGNTYTVDYVYTQAGAIKHDGTDTDDFDITVTDGDGDTVHGQINVTIVDDTPTANDDTDSGVEDVAITGNILTGAGTDKGEANADASGADGWKSEDSKLEADKVTPQGDGWTDLSSTELNGYDFGFKSDQGTMYFKEDGSYEFVPSQSLQDKDYTFKFDYTITDGDGSTDNATLIITVDGDNDAPTVEIFKNLEVREAGVGTILGPNALDLGIPVAFGKIEASDVDSSKLSYSVEGATQHTGEYIIPGVIVGPITTPEIKIPYDFSLESVDGYGTLYLDSATGNYIFVLNNNNETVNNLAEGQTLSPTPTFTIIVKDEHGAETKQEVSITIKGTNDRPDLSLATTSIDTIVTEDSADNSVEGTWGVQDNDSDGSIQTITVAGGTGTLSRDEEGEVTGLITVEGTYGNLVLKADGTYEYTLGQTAAQKTALDALGENESKAESFTVTTTDKHGSYDSEKLEFTVKGTNDTPVIKTDESNLNVIVDDSNLQDGTTPERADFDSGKIVFTSVETMDGGKITLKIDQNGDGILEEVIFDINYDTTNGWTLSPAAVNGQYGEFDFTLTGPADGTGEFTLDYTYTQTENYNNHKVDGATSDAHDDTEPAAEKLEVSIQDGKETSGKETSLDATITVDIKDDGPVISLDSIEPSDVITLTTSDDIDADLNGDSVADKGITTFDGKEALGLTDEAISKLIADKNINFGADGEATTGSVEITYSLSVKDGWYSIATGGNSITLVEVDGKIVGQYTENGEGKEAFTLEVGADGTLTLTQKAPIDHVKTSTVDTATDKVLKDLIDLEAKVTVEDGDGDTASDTIKTDITLTFTDEGPKEPTVTPDKNPDTGKDVVTLDEAHLDKGTADTNKDVTVGGSIILDFGTDGMADGSVGGFTTPFLWDTPNGKDYDPTDSSTDPVFGNLETSDGKNILWKTADDGQTLLGYAEGDENRIIVEVTLDAAAKQGENGYTVTLKEPVSHKDGNDEELSLEFEFSVKDADGSTAEGSVSVIIKDDAPKANDDTDSVEEGNTIVGNVITGENTNEGTDNKDEIGADGYENEAAKLDLDSLTAPDNTWTKTTGEGTVTFTKDGHSVTFEADGTYTFTAPDTLTTGASYEFGYTITDKDGDSAPAKLTVTVEADNDAPIIDVSQTTNVTLSEAYLEGGTLHGTTGNLDGDATIVDSHVSVGGKIVYSDSDSDVTFAWNDNQPNLYTSDNEQVEWKADGGILIGYVGDKDAGTYREIITVTTSESTKGTIEYEVTLNESVLHDSPDTVGGSDYNDELDKDGTVNPNAADTDGLSKDNLEFGFTLDDGTNSTPGSVNVTIQDDILELNADAKSDNQTTATPGEDFAAGVASQGSIEATLKDNPQTNVTIDGIKFTVATVTGNIAEDGLDAFTNGEAGGAGNLVWGTPSQSGYDPGMGVVSSSSDVDTEIGYNQQEAIIIAVPEPGIAYSVDLTVSCLYNGSSDTLADIGMVYFYKDGVLVGSAEISGKGTIETTTGSTATAGFDTIVVVPVGNGNNSGSMNNSEFYINGVEFKHPEEYIAKAEGKIELDATSGADGINDAGFGFANGTIEDSNPKITLTVQPDGSLKATDVDGNLYYTVTVNNITGEWTVLQHKDLPKGVGIEFDITATDEDGDTATLPVTVKPYESLSASVDSADDAPATEKDVIAKPEGGNFGYEKEDGTFEKLDKDSEIEVKDEEGNTIGKLTVDENDNLEFTQTDNYEHDSDKDDAQITVKVPVVDENGNVTGHVDVTINIADAKPDAKDDFDTIGTDGKYTGNILTGEGTSDEKGEENTSDEIGADGWQDESTKLESTDITPPTLGGWEAVDVPADKNFDFGFEDDNGNTIFFDKDGNYEFIPSPDLPIGEHEFEFGYDITDGDGDADDAKLTISVTVENKTPEIEEPKEPTDADKIVTDTKLETDDSNLAEGTTPDGSDSDSGQIVFRSEDTMHGGKITIGDTTFNVVKSVDGTYSLQAPDGADFVISNADGYGELIVHPNLDYNSDTGEFTLSYTYEQNKNYSHDNDVNNDDIPDNDHSQTAETAESFKVTIQDGKEVLNSETSDEITITVDIKDDGPVIAPLEGETFGSATLNHDGEEKTPDVSASTSQATVTDGTATDTFIMDFGADMKGVKIELPISGAATEALGVQWNGTTWVPSGHNGNWNGVFVTGNAKEGFTIKIGDVTLTTSDNENWTVSYEVSGRDDVIMNFTDGDGDRLTHQVIAEKSTAPEPLTGSITVDESDIVGNAEKAIEAGTQAGTDVEGEKAYDFFTNLPAGMTTVSKVEDDTNNLYDVTIEDGKLKVTLKDTMDHTVDGSTTEAHDDSVTGNGGTITVTVTDGAGKDVEIELTVTIEDDGPVMDVSSLQDILTAKYEGDKANNAGDNYSNSLWTYENTNEYVPGQLYEGTSQKDLSSMGIDKESINAYLKDNNIVTFGADGAAAENSIVIGEPRLEIDPEALEATSITSGGRDVTLYNDNGVIKGFVDTDNDGIFNATNDTLIFDVTLDGETVSLKQYGQLDHIDTGKDP